MSLCLLVGLPNPLRVHPTSISYVCKVFKHLDMLWMGIWVHPHTDLPVKVWGGCLLVILGVDLNLSLSDDNMPWVRLIVVPVECNSHPYNMYGKCFRTLICYEYGYMGPPSQCVPVQVERVNFLDCWVDLS